MKCKQFIRYDVKNLILVLRIETPKALLRQGLVYYNANDNNKALEKFKRVASQFPSTEEAVQAVGTARLIYIVA